MWSALVIEAIPGDIHSDSDRGANAASGACSSYPAAAITNSVAGTSMDEKHHRESHDDEAGASGSETVAAERQMAG